MVLWLQPCTDTEKPTAYCELVICWLTLFSPIHSMGHGNLLRACGFSNRSLPQNDPLNCWVSFHLSQPKTCSQGIKNLYTLMQKTTSKEWNPCLPLSQPYTTFIFNEQDRKVESPLCDAGLRQIGTRIRAKDFRIPSWDPLWARDNREGSASED